MPLIPKSRNARLVVLVLAGVLALTACADGRTAQPAGGGDREQQTSTGFNQADVAFLQNMTPHHAQATTMAQLAQGRAAHSELTQLADRIISTQTQEIETMRSLLAEAGVEPSAEGAGGMDHGGGHMPGMMSEAQMAELRGLQGEPFDLAFLEMMSVHHRAAIEMAEQVLQEGENPRVADLARQIIDAQRTEIEQMAAWQQQWNTT
jgi:uncharacterized protein (DUF305 family)